MYNKESQVCAEQNKLGVGGKWLTSSWGSEHLFIKLNDQTRRQIQCRFLVIAQLITLIKNTAGLSQHFPSLEYTASMHARVCCIPKPLFRPCIYIPRSLQTTAASIGSCLLEAWYRHPYVLGSIFARFHKQLPWQWLCRYGRKTKKNKV